MGPALFFACTSVRPARLLAPDLGMHDTTAHTPMLDDLEHDDVSEASDDGRSPAVRALEAVVEPVLRTMGYELVLLEWSAAGRHRRLRLFVDIVDSAAGGVTIDDCARLSPIVSNALDAAEAADDAESAEVRGLLDGPYSLEVSSPGLDRPLTKLAHFLRFTGQRATVRTHAPIGDSPQRTFRGRIDGVEPEPGHDDDPRRGTVLLEADDGTLHRIPLPAIRRANLVYAPPGDRTSLS
jgi:ribosome maturation factor RimP